MKNLIKVMSVICCGAFSCEAAVKKTQVSPEPPPIKRNYKESETGIAYTFARINLGSLNQIPAFVNVVTDDARPINNKFKYKNISEKEANEFTYSYVQTLGSNENKLFVTVDYIHGDGSTSSPLPLPSSEQTMASFVHPFFRGKVLDMVEEITSNELFTIPYFTCVKNHFDLGAAQSGVLKRLMRSKHTDVFVYGGLDLAYFSNFYKISILGIDTIESAFSWAKSSKNVTSVIDPDSVPDDYKFFNPQGKEGPYTRSFKNHFYGMGPLLGGKLQVPFYKDYLRMNMKLEVSALMGYGSTYFHYDQAFYEPVDGSFILAELDQYDSKQKHSIRFVPTVRGEVSLDVIVKNFGLSVGFQEQVYFMLMDINPLVDHQEFMTEYNYSTSSSFSHGNGNSSRSRLGDVIYGGPFLKVSYFF
jgi:hypothetical protein